MFKFFHMNVTSISIDAQKTVEISINTPNIFPIFFGRRTDRYIGEAVYSGGRDWKSLPKNKAVRDKVLLEVLNSTAINYLKNINHEL